MKATIEKREDTQKAAKCLVRKCVQLAESEGKKKLAELWEMERKYCLFWRETVARDGEWLDIDLDFEGEFEIRMNFAGHPELYIQEKS